MCVKYYEVLKTAFITIILFAFPILLRDMHLMSEESNATECVSFSQNNTANINESQRGLQPLRSVVIYSVQSLRLHFRIQHLQRLQLGRKTLWH